jgi:hypothetical protein
LVDRAVQVDPPTGDLDIGFISEPAITWRARRHGRAASINNGVKRWTPEHGDMVDLNVAFDEKLLNVALRQPVAQVPTYHHRDHLRREAEASEAGSRRGRWSRARTHPPNLPDLVTRRCNSA